MSHLQIEQLLQLKRFREAHDLARRSVAQRPEDASTYYQLALALNGLGEVREAIAANDRAIALDPTMASCFWLRGLFEAAQGQFRRAEAAHETSLALDPHSLLLKGGFVQTILDEPPDSRFAGRRLRLLRARELADSMVQSNPNNEYAHVMSSKVHLAHREIPEADRAIRKALHLNPESAAAHHLLGKLYERSGDLRNAGDAYVASGRLDPRSSESRERLRNLGTSIPMCIIMACLAMLYFWAKLSGVAEAKGVDDIAPVALAAIIGLIALRKRTKINTLNPEAKRIYESSRSLR